MKNQKIIKLKNRETIKPNNSINFIKLTLLILVFKFSLLLNLVKYNNIKLHKNVLRIKKRFHSKIFFIIYK